MKSLLFLMLFGAFFFTGYSQFPVYGKIDVSELTNKSCPIDKDAAAMVLFSYQSVRCTAEGYTTKIVTEKRVRLKIFNEKGFKYANIKIPYFSRGRQTKMKDISGIIYNLDASGKVVTQRVERKQIFKNKSEDNLSLISFSFPDLRAGSVIEYEYTQVEHDSYFIMPWSFQEPIPVMEAYCNIYLPGYERLNYRIKSAYPIWKDDPNNVSSWSSVDEKVLRLSARDISAFKPEPMMSSLKDNIPRVEFSLRISSVSTESGKELQWALINSRLNHSFYFGDQITRKIAGTDQLVDSARKIDSKEERVAYLYHYIQKNFKWNKRRSFAAYDLDEVWKQKGGSSGELNLLLINVLLKSGLDCFPILVSTRDNGKIDQDFPSISQFNGLNVWVNDSTSGFLLDATTPYTSYKVPPENTLNRYAFAIDTLNGQWVYLTDNRPLYKSNVSVMARFDSAYVLTGEAGVLSYDYAKAQQLKEREKEEDEIDEDVKEERDRKSISLSIHNYSEEGAEDPQKPLFEKFSFNYEVTNTNDLYYFSPVFLSSLTQNPFTADTRNTDIDMGCNQYFSFSLNLTIPDDMEVESFPQGILLRNSDTSIVFRRVSAIEGKKAMLRFTLEFNYSLVPREEYPGLKEFYKKLFALLGEQVVLKRIQKNKS